MSSHTTLSGGLLDPAALDAVFDYLLDLRSGEAELRPAREPSA